MERKGFTLVELLAVLVILSILALIIIPSVSGTIKQSRESAYEKQIHTLETAAKKWGLENDDSDDKSICSLVYDADNDKAISVGDEYKCDPGDGKDRKFYVLEVKLDTVSLLLGEQLTSTVAWNKDGISTAGEELDRITTGWKNVSVSLPTKQQIYNINNSIDLTNSPWLYANANHPMDGNPPYGYWTETLSSTEPDGDGNVYPYYVSAGGLLGCGDIAADASEFYGVAPVITVPITLESSSDFSVDFNTLYTCGYITEYPVINPKTKEELEGCILITYNDKYKQYEYKYTRDNNKCN